MLLSECAYKRLEVANAEALAAKLSALAGTLPPGWVELDAVQLTLPGHQVPQQ
jgi:hypothetical protein